MNSYHRILIFLCFAMSIHFSAWAQSEIVEMTVDSKRVECGNFVKRWCLQVKYENSSDWENIIAPIAGFKYEPGFIYHIKVRKERIASLFQDEIAFRYTLLEILGKEKDVSQLQITAAEPDSMSINLFNSANLFTSKKTWMLSTINGYTPVGRNAFLIFDSSTNRVQGNNGCNSISGEYNIDGQRIKFSKVVSTMMVCDDEKDNQLEIELMKLLNLSVFEIDVQRTTMLLYSDNQLVLSFGIVKY